MKINENSNDNNKKIKKRRMINERCRTGKVRPTRSVSRIGPCPNRQCPGATATSPTSTVRRYY